MVDLSGRARGVEMMDDFSIADERLKNALRELTYVNRWLGGYSSVARALRPLRRAGGSIRVLDIGAGIGDLPAYLVRWGAMHDLECRVVGLDANAATVQYAREYLDESMDGALRSRVRVVEGDARRLSYETNSFDIVTAALFLHHFPDEEAVVVLKEMKRVARRGIVVSDLHRHRAAYEGIRVIGRLFSGSEMLRHDGPLSVRRGFRLSELERLASEAELGAFTVRRRWAFRWVLSTVK